MTLPDGPSLLAHMARAHTRTRDDGDNGELVRKRHVEVTERQQRSDEITKLLAAAGLAPMVMFLTQPPVPRMKDRMAPPMACTA